MTASVNAAIRSALTDAERHLARQALAKLGSSESITTASKTAASVKTSPLESAKTTITLSDQTTVTVHGVITHDIIKH